MKLLWFVVEEPREEMETKGSKGSPKRRKGRKKRRNRREKRTGGRKGRTKRRKGSTKGNIIRSFISDLVDF